MSQPIIVKKTIIFPNDAPFSVQTWTRFSHHSAEWVILGELDRHDPFQRAALTPIHKVQQRLDLNDKARAWKGNMREFVCKHHAEYLNLSKFD